MDKEYVTNCIVDGMRLYFRILGQCSNMNYCSGNIEYILPDPSFNGPSVVFHVSFNQDTALKELKHCIEGIKAGKIPSYWCLSPKSSPTNIFEMLLANNFVQLAQDKPEPGMAMSLNNFSNISYDPHGVKIIRVQNKNEFRSWVTDCRY